MTSTVTEKLSMSELRAETRSLYVQNTTPLLWTLHEKVGNGQKIDLELKPYGQPGSIAYLPPAALDAPGIARNHSLGKITVDPNLEAEMIALSVTGSGISQSLLNQFQITVEQSPQARAIDVSSQVQERLDQVNRRRTVTAQSAQSVTRGDAVDEFINPRPIAPEAVLEKSTEIKSVTITRPAYLPSEN